MYSKILGIGSYLLFQVCINVDLEKMVEISDEWIVVCIGICECCIVVDNEIVVDMVFFVV